MSMQSRPNFNAVGYLMDILDSIKKHLRGRILVYDPNIIMSRVLELRRNEIREFVELIDSTVDQILENQILREKGGIVQ